MKNSFAIFMISMIATIASPVLAQSSVEPNQLVLGLNTVTTVAEWAILIGLILSMLTSSWLIVNRRSNRINDHLKVLIMPISLGTIAAGTAIILESWSPLLILDVGFAVAGVVALLIASLTFPGMNEEDTLRDEYDLRSLAVRKFGPERKIFNGKSEP
jgi:hypothetical protein